MTVRHRLDERDTAARGATADPRSPITGPRSPVTDPRSPITGMGRADWLRIADDWLGQVRRHSSPEGAMTRLPGRITADGLRRECMETVCRSFLLAAPRIAASDDATAEEHLAWYTRAILAGTREGGAEAWPRGVACRTPLQGITNSIVEAANLAFGLYVTRDRLWARLSRPEQRQLASWLLHHAQLEAWQSNWQLFPAMAEGFLRAVGEDTGTATGWRNVARVESFYLGEGWYTDGPERAIDYYNAWAIHPYLWAWYRMTDAVETAEGVRHLERLSAFVGSVARFVAPDGSLLHFGRSLTYRTAWLAALWCAEISGVNPLSPGATRRLASGVLARFVKKGVGVGGPLSLGWYEPFEPACQDYSGFGSPYLAGIGFLGLALPEDAPVWTAVEEGQPTETARFTTGMATTGWVVSAPGDGVVRLVNHGSDHAWIPVGDGLDADDPHYAKFAYSTHTAPGTAHAFVENVDSHLALIADDGRASRRVALRGSRVAGPAAGSVHLPQLDRRLFDGCAVTTVSFVDGPFEVRAHLIETPRSYPIREGGFAVADAVPPAHGTASVGRVAGRPTPADAPRGADAAPAAWVRGEGGLTAACIGLHGWSAARVFTYRGADAMGEYSAAPALTAECGPGHGIRVALHVLDPAGVEAVSADELLAAWRAAVTVSVDGTRVEVAWASGRTDAADLETFVPWDHHTGPKAANL